MHAQCDTFRLDEFFADGCRSAAHRCAALIAARVFRKSTGKGDVPALRPAGRTSDLTEPLFDEMIRDPVFLQVMAGDGVTMDALMGVVTAARRKLRGNARSCRPSGVKRRR